MRFRTLSPLVGVALAFAAFVGSTARAQETIIGLNFSNQLFTFSSTTFGQVGSLNGTPGFLTPIMGLVNGDTIVAIDLRPQTGELYALGQTGSVLNLYTISQNNPTLGQATLLSTLTPTLANAGSGGSTFPIPFVNAVYSIDFNPQANALRIINDQGGNYRITAANYTTGTTFSDLTLSQTGVTGIGYTNNFANSASTQLFDVQSGGGAGGNSTLFLQNPPNAGTLSSQGSTGFDFNQGDLDISGVTGVGYYADSVTNSFYRFDNITSSSTATLVGSIVGGGTIRSIAAPLGITAAPEPVSLALVGVGLFASSGMLARRKRSRGTFTLGF